MSAIEPIKKIARAVLPPRVRDAIRQLQRLSPSRTPSNTEHWTDTNVTGHLKFRTVEESLAYFDWRNDIYPDYIDLMPVGGLDGQVVLDYGCGPGNDLVGIAHFSKPARLIGVDISPASLAEAKDRLALHGAAVEFIRASEHDLRLPVEDASIDVVHSSGAVHHTTNPVAVLREFRRILKPEGYAQVMVYNYESIHLHLWLAYVLRIVEEKWADMPLRDAFARTTDGEDCPIAEVYTPAEFAGMAEEAGLDCSFLGAAVTMQEMDLLPRRFDAITDRRLPPEHRRFLSSLEFDRRGIPQYRGHAAGVDACYRLTRRD